MELLRLKTGALCQAQQWWLSWVYSPAAIHFFPPEKSQFQFELEDKRRGGVEPREDTNLQNDAAIKSLIGKIIESGVSFEQGSCAPCHRVVSKSGGKLPTGRPCKHFSVGHVTDLHPRSPEKLSEKMTRAVSHYLYACSSKHPAGLAPLSSAPFPPRVRPIPLSSSTTPQTAQEALHEYSGSVRQGKTQQHGDILTADFMIDTYRNPLKTKNQTNARENFDSVRRDINNVSRKYGSIWICSGLYIAHGLYEANG